MATIGLELCDAGFLTASCHNSEPHLIAIPDKNGAPDWPGFCSIDGTNLALGRAGEDHWFVHPRRVMHNFWARLTHEPAPLALGAKNPSFSELSFYFLREYAQRLAATVSPVEKIVVAVPGSYLKDPATEDEKIGLLLGMFGELKLPLAGLVDMACASLCDPHAPGFNPAHPVVVVDLQLEGADITLLGTEERVERQDFIHLPQLGYAQLLKQLTATMGNRFLRQTTFDILEDGRIEQTFFRQTKEFLVNRSPEWRYHINTATRGYEMMAKREQLASDANAFVVSLVQSVQRFVQEHEADPCTIALSDRTGQLPGIETRLRGAGFSRIIRLPRGAAACGASHLGNLRFPLPAEIEDVPLDRSVALSEAHHATGAAWEARLHKNRHNHSHTTPTHAILHGVGRELGDRTRFTIGIADLGPDLALPDTFNAASDCAVALQHDHGRFWFTDPAGGGATRTAIDAGDRLILRCGNVSADVLFAHCPAANGQR